MLLVPPPPDGSSAPQQLESDAVHGKLMGLQNASLLHAIGKDTRGYVSPPEMGGSRPELHRCDAAERREAKHKENKKDIK